MRNSITLAVGVCLCSLAALVFPEPASATELQLDYPDDKIELVLQEDGTYDAVPTDLAMPMCNSWRTWSHTIVLGDCMIKNDLGDGAFSAQCTDNSSYPDDCSIKCLDADLGIRLNFGAECGDEDQYMVFFPTEGQITGTIWVCE